MTREEPRQSPHRSEHAESSVHRAQLSNLQGLVALSMLMTDTSDAERIVELASSAVPSFALARCDGAFVEGRGWLGAAGACARRSVRAAVEKQLRRLSALGGGLEIEHDRWAWAFPMGSLERTFGFFVIAADTPPPEGEQFLLRLLAQYLGIAIANAELHARERGTAEALQILNDRLERSIAIHSRLTEAAQGLGLGGIAEAIHDLTGYPVAIEDSYGNLVAWAGPNRAAFQLPGHDRRAEMAEVAPNSRAPVRVGDHLAMVCGGSGERVAVLALVDSADTAGDEERMALEHGATVLALELSRIQSVLEAESRLGRDLLEELLAGSDDEHARVRAQLLGYDLGQQQRVGVVECADNVSYEDRLFHAVRRAAHDVGARSLLASRRGTVVVLTDASQRWAALHAAIAAELGDASCRVGVGGVCDHVGDVPRSYREAQLALRLPSAGGSGQAGVTSFDELGVFQILAEAQDPATVERFVRGWLGQLLDYDASRGAQLVLTLSAYLESGGSHALSARALNVHRNTLRYRLTRIREISGHDLANPDVQFNLQLATRAWRTLAAMQPGEAGDRFD